MIFRIPADTRRPPGASPSGGCATAESSPSGGAIYVAGGALARAGAPLVEDLGGRARAGVISSSELSASYLAAAELTTQFILQGDIHLSLIHI